MKQAPAEEPATERELVDLLIAHLLRNDPDTDYVREARTHGRSRADILLRTGGELVSVEAKLGDWRRAIAQALLNRQMVDRSFIALWHERATAVVIEEAGRWGVGVLAVQGSEIREMLDAPAASPHPELKARADLAFGAGR